jgi:tRNA pseudouridine synthase 10
VKNPIVHEHFERACSTFSKSETTFVCPFCFGLLDSIHTEEYRTFLEKEIISSGYQFSSFGIILLVTSATFIRDHLIYCFLLELGLNIGPIQKIETVKEIVKGKTIELISGIFGKPYVGNVDNQQLEGFDITVHFTSEEGNAIYKALTSLKPNPTQTMNKKRERNYLSCIAQHSDSQKETIKLLESLDISLIQTKVPMVPEKVLKSCSCVLSYKVPAIVLAGRYIKLSRNISQTPLILGDRRIGDTSLEEAIGSIVMPYFESTEPKLCGAGREDLDVRMLGRGRPFIFEMGTPKKLIPTNNEGIEISLFELQEKINESNKDIIVSDLQIIPTKNSNSTLVDSENEKRKHYRALIELSKPLDSSKLNEINQKEPFQILQKTPIRVLHRRALLDRERMIHSIQLTHIRDNLLYLDLVTQAGTYIKEFVHGDLGRTNPNLSSLLSWDNFECDIILLDVMHVDLEWPPKTEWSTKDYKYQEMIDEMPQYILSLTENKFQSADEDL